MSASVLPSLSVFPTPLGPIAPPRDWPHPFRWTCAEIQNLGDAGLFEGRPVLLVDGELVEMPNPNPPHSAGNALVEESLRAAFGRGFLVRGQSPLILDLWTDPVPDAAVVVGTSRDYSVNHPTTALLVVEVSDSTLRYDTGEKASLYAEAGIGDYWVLDLVNRQLWVHRVPQADPVQRFGFRYSSVVTLAPGESINPLAMPAAAIRVNDLLP